MKIHVATFAPDTTLAALDYALDVVAVSGGSITAVHVVSRPEDRTLSQEEQQPSDAAGPMDDHDSGGRPLGVSDAGPGPPERPDDDGTSLVSGTDQTSARSGEMVLSRERTRAESAGVEIEMELLYGDAYRAILEFAEADGASLIVVEKPAKADTPGSSVTRRLAEDSWLPVVVVPA